MDISPHDDDNRPTVTEAGSGSRAITLRGPAACLLVGAIAFPWSVGTYVIVRAVLTYLTRPAQRAPGVPPRRVSHREAAYRARRAE